MNKYHIRFNKSKGNPGRGSKDHAWRVFENNEAEYIVKHFSLEVPCFDEITDTEEGFDNWNICCYGFLDLDYSTSTATIKISK